MTLDEQVEKRVYDKLRAFDGLELSGNSPVDSSISSVLSQGEVLADNGEQYESIQAAVDASDNWVFAGPGTYYENVVIDKDDFTLQGAGYDTHIDGGDVGSAITVLSTGGDISSLRVTNSANSQQSIDAENSAEINFTSLHISSDNHEGIRMGEDSIIRDSTVINCPNQHGIQVIGGCIVTNNRVDNCGTSGAGAIDLDGTNNIVANCTVTNSVNVGINLQSTPADSIVIGNRVHNSAGSGIVNNQPDVIIANNRVSDSGGSDISNSGAGVVVEGNLTGSAN